MATRIRSKVRQTNRVIMALLRGSCTGGIETRRQETRFTITIAGRGRSSGREEQVRLAGSR